MLPVKADWLLVIGLFALTGCAPSFQGSGLAGNRVPSPNFDERRPNFVIIHQTGSDTAERALGTLTDPARKVSAHYLVDRDGAIHQLVDERARAWHAGESWWSGVTDLNSMSIGIELDNNGEEPFADVQITRLMQLLADLKQRHRIPAANFIGHADIAPARKVDPSRHFPWKLLAENGFGLWCDPPASLTAGIDERIGLQALGYAVADFTATTRAFRRHFAGDDSTAELSKMDKAKLQCLVGMKSAR